MIQRKKYLEKLIALKDKQLIKVVTGIRRCGKSTLFKIYQDYLLKNGVNEKQIQHINFEDDTNEDLRDRKKLHKYILDNSVKDKKNYIFLDEIQNIPQFQKIVDSLYIRDNFDVYITGSNAYLLSGELATLLSGRYIEIQMLPLSFKEYVSAFDDNKYELLDKYNNYLKNSSFPYTLQLNNNEEIIKDYLKGIYNTIILKDVVTRKHIADVSMLESIIRFMFDNIGNICSIKKISDTMTSNNRKITPPTVENYLSSLVDTFILHKVGRFDIKGKQHLQIGDKYYLTDVAFRFLLLGNNKTDFGRILENIVYLELIRRGYEVFIGKIDNIEVDFIALKNGDTYYFQVAETVKNEKTLKRELKPLEHIKDHNQKFLLTLDNQLPVSHNGIKQLYVLHWLLQ